MSRLVAMNYSLMQKKSFNTEVQEIHFLYPSNLFSSRKEAKVKTVLGSCIAVCLYDPVLKVGGINHFMLPLWNGEGLPTPKYGNIAIEKLLEKMIEMGSIKRNIIAKVFGGAESLENTSNSFKIGSRNAQLAADMLQEHRIRVVGQSTGGNQGRNILFNTSTGEVLLRFIKKNVVQQVKKN
jgi:chemotaxis protein CheD